MLCIVGVCKCIQCLSGAEEGHWSRVRHEDLTQGGHAGERTGNKLEKERVTCWIINSVSYSSCEMCLDVIESSRWIAY